MTLPWPLPDPAALQAQVARGLPFTAFFSRLDDPAALAAWALQLRARLGPAGRAARLIVCALAAPPGPAGPPLPARWPASIPGLHRLDAADLGEPAAAPLELLLAQDLADPARAWRQVQAQWLWVDPSAPMPAAAVARLAAPGARLRGPGLDATGQEALRRAGFVAASAADAAAGEWRFAPRAPQPASRALPPREALIIGAGIAGASAAAALAARGWQCQVLDRLPQAAMGASGNPAGIVHGTVHAQDGPHARFTRAAALFAQGRYARLLAQGVPGALQGLLRAGAEPGTPDPPAAWAERWHRDRLAGSGLRAENAWFFPGAGWVSPRHVVQALLANPGVRFVGSCAVASLHAEPGPAGTAPRWAALDATGRVLGSAPVLVLAQGGHWQPLLAGTGAWAEPVLCARGQVSWFRHPGEPPRWPLAGGGYCVALGDGTLLCGATTQAVDVAAMDADTTPREEDHAFNLARLQQQTGIAAPAGAVVEGRVGWRLRALDKLPFVGPLADTAGLSTEEGRPLRLQLQRLPRVPGLYGIGAMAGRGFTWGPLAGEVLASWVDGSAMPLEGPLVDALDPARLWLRRQLRPA